MSLKKALDQADKILQGSEVSEKYIPKIEDTDYLEVEVLTLPILDASRRFLYRFSKPFATVMSHETIRISYSFMSQPSAQKKLKEILLEKWKEMVTDSISMEKEIPQEAQEMFDKWLNFTEIRIIDLKLIRDE
jgi:hypothetical protein